MRLYSLERLQTDLILSGRSPMTVKGYLSAVRLFERWLGRSPSEAGEDDVRAWLLHLRERRLSPCTLRQYLFALCFLYRVTLERPEVVTHIPRPHIPPSHPRILAPDEVARLLDAVPNLRLRTALSVVYAAGLRVGEVVALQVEDIDSPHGLIHVRHGKGAKPRAVMLSPRLLADLRAYWKACRPPRPWLFAGQQPGTHFSVRRIQDACRQAARRAGLSGRITVHTLRHAFATHLLEHKTDLRTIQALLGHARIDTTAVYLHMRLDHIEHTPSPFDRLPPVSP